MDTSNPLPIVPTSSPSLPTAPSSSVQTGPVPSASNHSPQVSAMMHLQQLNIQQTILMQQHALTQQALSKAVKSPAEIAAARAAEISKQLEGSGAPEKKISERSKSRSTSKSKSRSRSPSSSRSRSKSKSRSPSCSPAKRQRGRSRSLSPIRYRRDYYPSYRSRDHYGYRGHNYRSYYRGSYNDYPRYRYGRDYDYHYRRHSRSRERRRSRTRSRSPRRDRSRGRRRSPSVSPPLKKRSLTGSLKDSRKGSVSPPIKRDGSRSRHTSPRSLSREAARSRSVSSGSVNVSPARSSSRSVSQEKSESNHIVHKSPPIEESSEDSEKIQTAVNLRRQQKGLSAPRRGRTDLSSSPSRSLFISLKNDKYIHGSNKDLAKKRHESPEGGRSGDYDEAPISPGKKSASEAEDSEGRKSYHGHGRRGRLLARSSDAISDDDSKSDESMDDWRDDLKKVVKAKVISAAKEGEDNRLGKTKVSETPLTERAVNVNDYELEQDLVAHDDSPMVEEEQRAVSDGHGHAVVCDKPLEQASIFEEPKEVSAEDDDRETFVAETLVFEGPQPANVAHKERKQSFEDDALIDADANEMQSPISDKIKAEENSIAGDADGHLHHSYGLIYRHEGKHRDRSRSRDSKKGGAELAKHESRRGKHKRHRKKHKLEKTDEESEGTKKRHKRKHKREGDHSHKERKKKRHKRRSRLPTNSAEDSSSDGEIEVRSSSGKRKKGSKKRKATKRDVSESSTSSTS